MIRRPHLLILLPLAFAACHKRPGAETADAAAHGAVIPCALSGAKTFKRDCAVERTVVGNDAGDEAGNGGTGAGGETGNGLMLILHHPDGGFRRLLVTTDGRGVVTADGSDQAQVAVIDPGTIEVVVGDDRYRLPATVKGQSLPQR